MQTQMVISSNVESANFSLPLSPDEDADWFPVGEMSDEELAQASELHGVPVYTLKVIADAFQSLKDAIHDDLSDIWKRLESRK